MAQPELRHRDRQHRKSVASLLLGIHVAKRGQKLTIMCLNKDSRLRLFEKFRELAKEHDFEYRIKCNEFHAVEGDGVVAFVLPEETQGGNMISFRGLPDDAPSS